MTSQGATLQPIPDTQTDSAWQFAERVIKIGTGFLALIYAAGFLVVSVHHGRYGVIMFEFLRARVFAAGLLFAVLTAVPVIAVSRLFGLFGLGMPAGSREIKAEHLGFARACSIAQFSIFAYLFATSSRALFISTPTDQHSSWWVALSWFAMGVALISERKWLISHPFPIATVNVIAGILFLFSIHKWESREMTVAVYWFCGVAWAFLGQRHLFVSAGHRQRFDWERWALASLALVFVFATAIYGRIKPSWGGGVVAPVTVHFARITPFSSSSDIKAYLIDETDKGYYLTHSVDDHKASFIPREAVASIDFEELPSQATH